MFKALAELAMRGRYWAIALALLGGLVPLLSQAVLGLVTLRKGWQEGFIVTLWASLPSLVGLWFGQVAFSVAMVSIAVLWVGYLACVVLRSTVAWSTTLVALVAISALSALLLMVSSGDIVDQVVGFFTTLATSQDGVISEEAQAFFDSWTLASTVGLLAYWIGAGSLAGLLLSRWWQALLYNPGGFRQEFHSQRLPVVIAIVSGSAWLYCYLQGLEYQLWAGLFAVPLWLSGLGMAHWLVARYKLGTPPLVLMYVLQLIPVVGMLTMLLAALDAALDLRNRFKLDQPPEG